MVGITYQQSLEEVTPLAIEFRDHLTQRSRGVVHGEGLEVRELAVTWPRLLRRCSQQLENALELVVHVAPGEQGTTGVGQLGENATRGPVDIPKL